MQSCLQLLDLVVQDFSLPQFCHRFLLSTDGFQPVVILSQILLSTPNILQQPSLLNDTDYYIIETYKIYATHILIFCCTLNLEGGNSAKSGDESEIIAVDVRSILGGPQVGWVGQGGQAGGGGLGGARWDQTGRCSSGGTHQ